MNDHPGFTSVGWIMVLFYDPILVTSASNGLNIHACWKHDTLGGDLPGRACATSNSAKEDFASPLMHLALSLGRLGRAEQRVNEHCQGGRWSWSIAHVPSYSTPRQLACVSVGFQVAFRFGPCQAVLSRCWSGNIRWLSKVPITLACTNLYSLFTAYIHCLLFHIPSVCPFVGCFGQVHAHVRSVYTHSALNGQIKSMMCRVSSHISSNISVVRVILRLFG